MNRIYLKGRLIDNAKFVNRDENILKFTLAIKERYDNDLNKYLYRLIPCIVFEPCKEIVRCLTDDGQCSEIECEGIESKIAKKNGKSEKIFLIDPEYLKIINRKI
ncbi:MAG: hypothetical protein HWN67_07210 [Candidatus Helarchaeota archaeon]|nr:hypothetical protein [Candidatus Helarchaeota archaeon]